MEERPRIDVAIPPEVIASVDQVTVLGKITTGISGVIDATIVDKERYISTGRIEIATGLVEVTSMPPIQVGPMVIETGQVGVISTVGTYWQWNNQSIATGETANWGVWGIGTRGAKTRAVISNTGDVRVTIFVSNDNTIYYPYHVEDVSSGKVSTASFTERFNYMIISVYGITDAGYNLLVGVAP